MATLAFIVPIYKIKISSYITHSKAINQSLIHIVLIYLISKIVTIFDYPLTIITHLKTFAGKGLLEITDTHTK